MATTTTLDETVADTSTDQTAGSVSEDNPRAGRVLLPEYEAEIGPDTKLAIVLPRKGAAGGSIPFVLRAGPGDLSLFMERAELERLVVLGQRALDQHAARDAEGADRG